jgi:tRNA pseudouridine38-40 synthase
MGQNRYFIYISFKGTKYHGWQIQPNAISVQQVLNKALSVIFHEDIVAIGAGRTDAGVHARLFVAHFNYNDSLPASTIKSLNAILPPDIAVLDIKHVKSDAHARFSANKRTYKYTLLKRKNPFLNDYGWLYPFPLDLNKMQAAANYLLNESDFTSFSKLHTDVKTNLCKIYEVQWDEFDDTIVFTISADRFLRNMVRAVVGTLLEVGRNKIQPESFYKIIEKKDRCEAGMSVPAKGLELFHIEYPHSVFIL